MSGTDLDRVDWTDTTTVSVPAGERTATGWARAMFEEAPRPVRAVLRFSWRYLLLMGLGSSGDAEHVLGWRISEAVEDRVVLATHSRLGLDTRLVFDVAGDQLTMTTVMRQATRVSALVWTFVWPVHRLIVVLLLRRVSCSSGGQAR